MRYDILLAEIDQRIAADPDDDLVVRAGDAIERLVSALREVKAKDTVTYTRRGPGVAYGPCAIIARIALGEPGHVVT